MCWTIRLNNVSTRMSSNRSITILKRSIKSPPNHELFDQASLKSQYMKEVDDMKRLYDSYYRNYRKCYRKDQSLSQVPNDRFTDRIRLPLGKMKTVADVFESRNIKLKKKIGKGGYGVVYRAEFQKGDSKMEIAVKMINLRKSSNMKRMLEHLKIEIFILESYPHPNIILLMDHLMIDDHAYIIMELANCGSLHDEVERCGALKEDLVYEYFVQILKALLYLHTFRIAHRDLKLENLLLTMSKQDSQTKIVKMTDFGLSAEVYKPREGRIKTGTYGGTRDYMAPEIVRLDVYEDFDDECCLEYDPFKADIWALGVCLYEMLTSYLPFETRTKEAVFEAQINRDWHFPKRYVISKAAKRLTRSMLEPDPSRRIDPFGIWMHEWIQQCYIQNRGWKSTYGRTTTTTTTISESPSFKICFNFHIECHQDVTNIN
ncbi:hypothetical protein BLOT_016693 [Blomia tropicalis]|nr:hypothetical protein BLOT_016693 [Blomia tropicalis]